MAGSEEQHPLSPSTFLSPRITAQLDNSLDAIEDILLGGSNAAPSSPSTALAQTLNSNTTSATTTNQSQSLFNFTIGRERSNSYNISNAVHMEVQNNAKLPTFNIPVDRSNASWQKPAIRGRKRSSGTRHGTRSHAPSIGSGSEASNTTAPCSPIPKLRHQSDDNHMKLDTATSQAIDEIMRLNENDLNLPEYFLDDEDRASAALAYSFSGDMPQLLPTSTSLEDMSTTEGNGSTSRMPANGLDSTSLKRKQSITRLPYRRQKPLPIPKLKPPSPKISKKRKKEGSPLTSALANGSSIDSSNEVVLPNQIKAAQSIQSQKQVVATSTVTQSKKSDTMKPPRIAVPRPRTVVERPGSSNTSRLKEPSLPNPATEMKSQTSLHAAAHIKPKASITHATAQRSKVGFGDNHKVPSVPGPPPCRYTPSKAASGKPTSTKPKLPLNKKPIIKLPPKKFVPPTKSLPKDVGNIVAYERKKQRAKNARVKLNEAIDELGVAIDLAGSQSKERFNYIVKTSNCANPHAADDAKSRSSTVPTHPLAKLMDETIQQSASAKKWDRPSFVGLSATIIHSLNAQCEGLMREVAQLRSIAKEHMVADLDSQTSEAIVDGILQTSPPPAAKKQKLNDSLSDSTNDYTAQKLAKVMALNEQRRCLAIHNTVETPNILKNIASFLDPVSLCGCLCVSKKWRSQNIFQNVTLWLNICIKRFGVSAVRKWQDQDEETGTRKRKVDANYNTNLELYRRMSKENVKPYSTMEGTQFLGGSTLDGLVSCWVSLMDRSNGETSRSVIQQKVTNGEIKQVYVPIPMVELRLLIQNTGYSKGVIIIPDQQFSVDASTRRKGEKMMEVTGDDRFKRQTLHIERSASPGEPDPQQQTSISHEMCHLRLFETAVLAIHIHAKGCSTTSKFCTKGKSIQILVSIDGTTRPLSIPFHCMNDHRSK